MRYRNFVKRLGFTEKSANYRLAELFDSMEMVDWCCYYVLCRTCFTKGQVYYFLLRFCRLNKIKLKPLLLHRFSYTVTVRKAGRRISILHKLAMLADRLSIGPRHNIIFKKSFTIKQLHELTLDILEREIEHC